MRHLKRWVPSDDSPVPSDRRSKADPNVAEVCAGCGDVGLYWVAGEWYCEGCASCEVCQSPYCDEEEHHV